VQTSSITPKFCWISNRNRRQIWVAKLVCTISNNPNTKLSICHVTSWLFDDTLFWNNSDTDAEYVPDLHNLIQIIGLQQFLNSSVYNMNMRNICYLNKQLMWLCHRGACNCSLEQLLVEQDYRIGSSQKMSVDIDAIPNLLLLIQQKLCIVQYRHSSLSSLDKLRHPRSNAYSAEQVLLNKQQIWCDGAYPDCYRSRVRGYHLVWGTVHDRLIWSVI